MLSKSLAAGLKPGTGAKSRRSTPIKRASWVISIAVPNADAMACATFYQKEGDISKFSREGSHATRSISTTQIYPFTSPGAE